MKRKLHGSIMIELLKLKMCYVVCMAYESEMTVVASLIGDPSRSLMLAALMSGEALTATELANEASITKQTASSHLSKMLDANLLEVEKQGRHHYYRLANADVAQLLEALMSISAGIGMRKTKPGPKDARMRKARLCYDHLAGEMGVALFDGLVRRDLLSFDYTQKSENQIKLNDKGIMFFNDFGIDTDLLIKAKRPMCRICLDWSARRSHLSGGLGAAILNQFYTKDWVRKSETPRLLIFTQKGAREFKTAFGD